MSIQTDLPRIKNAKAAIKAFIEGKGVTVPEATRLDGMAALLESIEAGGGGTGIVYTSGTLVFSSNTECTGYVITHGLGVIPQIFILCPKYGSYENYVLLSFGLISEGLRNVGYTAQKLAYFYANAGYNMSIRAGISNNVSIIIDENTITLPNLDHSVFKSGLKHSWHAIGGIEA